MLLGALFGPRQPFEFDILLINSPLRPSRELKASNLPRPKYDARFSFGNYFCWICVRLESKNVECRTSHSQTHCSKNHESWPPSSSIFRVKHRGAKRSLFHRKHHKTWSLRIYASAFQQSKCWFYFWETYFGLTPLRGKTRVTKNINKTNHEKAPLMWVCGSMNIFIIVCWVCMLHMFRLIQWRHNHG